jgi:hypothetical protein
MLKAYILLDDTSLWDMFSQAYNAIMTYVRDNDGFLYRSVEMVNFLSFHFGFLYRSVLFNIVESGISIRILD